MDTPWYVDRQRLLRKNIPRLACCLLPVGSPPVFAVMFVSSARKTKVIVRIQGGLGNQLFQYAFALYLQEVMGLSVALESLCFRNDPYERSYCLDTLPQRIQVLSKTKARLLTGKSLTAKLVRLLCLVRRTATLNDHDLDRDMTAWPISFNSRNGIHYVGYGQFNKVVDSVPILIQDLLALRNTEMSRLNIFEHLPHDRIVALHVRRRWPYSSTGKQVHFDQTSQHKLGLDYYRSAIEFSKVRFADPFILIFGDDEHWCRNHMLPLAGKNCMLLCKHESRTDWQDLLLMSMAKCVVCSNSTFSWWGAKLSDGIVIAPKQWVPSEERNQAIVPHLLPSSWHLL